MKSSRTIQLVFGVVIVLFGLLLAACQDAAPGSPTPFPTLPATVLTQTGAPVEATLTELAANPALYKDELVTVTGLFNRQPLLVCEGEANLSPATWSLVEEGVTVLADGLDQQVRSLLPENLTMTAQGRLRLWSGLVGCGKQAQEQQVWYLDVTRILSPSPLTQATLTPDGFEVAVIETGEQTIETPQPTNQTAETPVEDAETAEITATIAVDAQPTQVAEVPTAEETTADAAASPTATQAGQSAAVTPLSTTEANVEATATVSGTASATPQVTPGTPTATPMGGATPTTGAGLTTPTPSSGEVVQMGDILDLDEEIGSAVLPAGRIHSYTIEIFEDEAFSVSAIAPVPADLVLSARLNGETIVDRQNLAAAGATESLDTSLLNQEGTYEIWVATENGAAAEYAIVAFFDDDFTIVFNGFLTPGQPRSNVSAGLDETHYWFFTGTSGQTATLSLTTGSANDGLMDIYGPGAEYLDTADDGFEGEDETITFGLPVTGLYAVAVSDIDYAPMTYTILLTLQ